MDPSSPYTESSDAMASAAGDPAVHGVLSALEASQAVRLLQTAAQTAAAAAYAAQECLPAGWPAARLADGRYLSQAGARFFIIGEDGEPYLCKLTAYAAAKLILAARTDYMADSWYEDAAAGWALCEQFVSDLESPARFRICENCGRIFKKKAEEGFRKIIRETRYCRRSCNVSANNRARRA